jgi:excisionase family DNA binding protein
MTEPVFLSVAEVAKTLHLSVVHTRRLITKGEIRSVRIGKRVLIPRQWLQEYMEELMATSV